MENLLEQRQKQFRATGMVLFEVSAGLLVARIVAGLLSGAINDTLLDVIFNVLMQVVFLLIGPFLIYKLALKKSFFQVLSFSNVRKPDWYIMLLCIPLGICCFIATIGISTIWQVILVLMGYTPGGGGAYPETFSAWLLLLNIFLTGVLPGICEEFTNRGGLVTTMRGSFNNAQTILLCGLMFGLFHQNITQIVYTFLFGMLMTALVLKTKSIFPAMAVHFINNSLSVYLDYADAYSLPLGGFFDAVNNLLGSNFVLAVFLWALVSGAGALIFFVILKLAKKGKSKGLDSAFSSGIRITEAEGEPVTDDGTPLEDKMLYKPVLRDWAFYIGALAMTAVTTIFTFIWGL